MNNQYTIIPSNLKFKSAPIVDQVITIDLNQTQEELTQFVRNTSISLPQLYNDERQASVTFRPTFKVQYVYDNTLIGTTDYKPFRDNLFYVDSINSVGSGVWRGYPQYYEFDFFREKIDDKHFAYSPQSAYTYNWTYYLTYPAANDGNVPMSVNYQNQTINWVAQDGIPFIINQSYEGGATIVSFQCLMPHGLQPGEFVELSFDYSGDKIFDVFSLGNGQYGSSDFVFNILNNGFTGNTFFVGRTGTFKRILNTGNLTETRSKYYVRKHKILFNESGFDVSKIGFELNPFNNEIQLELSSLTPNNITRVSKKTSSFTYDFTLKDNLVISGITDNHNRPVGEIFLSIINKGYSGYFNKSFNGVGLKQGWGFNLQKTVSTWWDDFNQNSFTNIPVQSYNNLPDPYIFYFNKVLNVGDLLDGDFCEWNDYDQTERVISPYIQKIKFNQDNFSTSTTQSDSNAMGYYYLPHIPMTLRVYSDYVETAPSEQVENIPDYAFFSETDQQFRWREPYLYGEFDNLNRGVNYPFLNKSHYPYRDYIFKLIPEGTNYQDILGGVNIAVQPLIDDCE
jgi:hypothetical protein